MLESCREMWKKISHDDDNRLFTDEASSSSRASYAARRHWTWNEIKIQQKEKLMIERNRLDTSPQRRSKLSKKFPSISLIASIINAEINS